MRSGPGIVGTPILGLTQGESSRGRVENEEPEEIALEGEEEEDYLLRTDGHAASSSSTAAGEAGEGIETSGEGPREEGEIKGERGLEGEKDDGERVRLIKEGERWQLDRKESERRRWEKEAKEEFDDTERERIEREAREELEREDGERKKWERQVRGQVRAKREKEAKREDWVEQVKEGARGEWKREQAEKEKRRREKERAEKEKDHPESLSDPVDADGERKDASHILQEPPNLAVGEVKIGEYIDDVLDYVSSSGCDQSQIGVVRRWFDEALKQEQSEQLLKERIRQWFSSHIHQIGLAKERELGIMDETQLLEYYTDKWIEYKALISSLFWNHGNLEKIALNVWEADFYNVLEAKDARLTQAAITSINQQRRGEAASTSDRSQVFIGSLIHMETALVSDPPAHHSDVYAGFKDKFRQASEGFYTTESTSAWLPGDTLLSNLERVRGLLVRERQLLIKLALPLTERQQRMKSCSVTLLEDHLEEIYTKFEQLLGLEGRNKELKCIYLVTYWIDDAVERIQSIFKSYTKQAAVAKLKADGLSPGDVDANVSALDKEQRQHLDMAQGVFGRDRRFIKSIREAFSEIFVEHGSTRTSQC